jgi:N-acetylmuramoyl-L-alanine amidase
LLSFQQGEQTMAWKGIVDRSFDPAGFAAYVRTLHWTAWRPSFIVLHNTGVPSLAQRPDGLTQQHIMALQGYYRDQQHWSAGPHLFIDDHQIWAFTPLTTPGVHSPSWNSVSLGVEMLGDYRTEPFATGRGLAVQHNAVAALATLSEALGLDAASLRLHHEDPKTTHRDCPGKNVVKAQVVDAVSARIAADHAGEHSPAGAG